jgi:hypothetical protein
LEGLFLAEAEFNSAIEAESLALPSFVFHEVSRDERSLEVNWSAPRAKISSLGCSNMGLR